MDVDKDGARLQEEHEEDLNDHQNLTTWMRRLGGGREENGDLRASATRKITLRRLYLFASRVRALPMSSVQATKRRVRAAKRQSSPESG